MTRRLVEINNEKATRLFSELRQEIKDKENEIGFDLLKSCGTVKDFIGTYKSTRSYGNCHRLNIMGALAFDIALNERLVQYGSDKDIKEVLLHELIHTVKDCFNHKWQFKNKAWTMFCHLGYDALRKDYNDTILNRQSKQERAKYILRCTGCGQTIYRERKSTFVEYPNRYTCGKCHGKFERIDLTKLKRYVMISM